MKVHPATPDSSAYPTARADPYEIVVHTRPGCPNCFTLRAGLRRAGLTFREISIWENPEAAAFVRSVANGNERVPTVAVGHLSMVNPSARRVRALAAAGESPTPKRGRWFRRPDVTLSVGDPFPDIELVGYEGRPWRTAEMRRRPLVLVLHRHLA